MEGKDNYLKTTENKTSSSASNTLIAFVALKRSVPKETPLSGSKVDCMDIYVCMPTYFHSALYIHCSFCDLWQKRMLYRPQTTAINHKCHELLATVNTHCYHHPKRDEPKKKHPQPRKWSGNRRTFALCPREPSYQNIKVPVWIANIPEAMFWNFINAFSLS